jgi:hypothetical protein
VFHWLERARPSVAVITDGSGSGTVGRLGPTTEVLDVAGATRLGGCLGFCSDRRAYEAILAADIAFFWQMLDRILDALGGARVGLVVSDALEHFNPSHDVCCLLASVLATRLARAQRDMVRHACFPLDGHPSAAVVPPYIEVALDEEALERKIRVATGYAELRYEVEAALRTYGRATFARECLWEAGDPFAALERFAGVPYYERVGRDRQSAGTYQDVITLDGHVRPLARALRARRDTPCA